jgi:hypothetical protein
MKGVKAAMQHIVNPQQTSLFDPYERVFSKLAYRRIIEGWQGVFRKVILEIMPVDIIAGKFSENDGRPTKELYSMAGLVFIMQFHNWTIEQAAEEYMINLGVQYALNLAPGGQSLSPRTLDRYLAIFRECDIAEKVFHDVTQALVEALEKDVSRQRLDSTHIFSNMARFGRTQLMGVVVKRFLTQVHRHDVLAYETLPAELLARYAPAANRLFGDTVNDIKSRKLIRQQVAEDMLMLIQWFEDTDHADRTTFKQLVRVFNEQCTVEEKRVKIKEKAGSRVLQNPSDPDATYDGLKGPGYQAQVAETCTDGDVQLITAVIPQPAAEPDCEAVLPVCRDLHEKGLVPEIMLCDAAYGSDANVQNCKAKEVELISPVNRSRRNDGKMHVDDFDIDPVTECVRRCPAGHAPLQSTYDPSSGKTRSIFDGALCRACPNLAQCPTTGKGNRRTFRHTPAQRRNAERLKKEETPAFRSVYSKRAGIEGTFSRIKSCLGLHRLRVRGSKPVFMALFLKLAGWNILQAAKSNTLRRKIAAEIWVFSTNPFPKWLSIPVFRFHYHLFNRLVLRSPLKGLLMHAG